LLVRAVWPHLGLKDRKAFLAHHLAKVMNPEFAEWFGSLTFPDMDKDLMIYPTPDQYIHYLWSRLDWKQREMWVAERQGMDEFYQGLSEDVLIHLVDAHFTSIVSGM
jgi:hypothetical protein